MLWTPPSAPLRAPHAPLASTRAVVRASKRVKLRAREHARLRCQNLELDILNLRQEIATLETTRKLLYARVLNGASDQANGSFVKTVREYFALQRDGYSPIVWRNKRGECDNPVNLHDFMVAVFDPAVAVDDEAPHERGLERFLELLAFKMKLVGDIRVQLLGTTVRETHPAGDTVLVSAKTRCRCVLSAFILDMTFPHVRQFPWLREKLIGREVTSAASSDFEFNVRTGQIVRFTQRVESVASILAVVDTAEEYQILSGERRNDVAAYSRSGEGN